MIDIERAKTAAEEEKTDRARQLRMAFDIAEQRVEELERELKRYEARFGPLPREGETIVV